MNPNMKTDSEDDRVFDCSTTSSFKFLAAPLVSTGTYSTTSLKLPSRLAFRCSVFHLTRQLPNFESTLRYRDIQVQSGTGHENSATTSVDQLPITSISSVSLRLSRLELLVLLVPNPVSKNVTSFFEG